MVVKPGQKYKACVVSAASRFGRGLQVVEDVERGQDLLTLHPLVHVAGDANTSCGQCLMPLRHTTETAQAARGQRCSACKAVFYCSKSCQKAAWKLSHKAECAALATDKGQVRAARPTLSHRQLRAHAR